MQQTQHKLANLFSFFKAVEQRRIPPLLQVDECLWTLRWRDLPEHETLLIQRPNDQQSFRFSFARPELTACPKPPDVLLDWVEAGWDSPDRPAIYSRSHVVVNHPSEPNVVLFEDDSKRLIAWSDWLQIREIWRTKELPARTARRVWERFFALHSLINREAAVFELMLGDGIFQSPEVHHPLLLRRVELTFIPETRTFQIEDIDRPTDFYATAFVNIPDSPVRAWQQDVLNGELHPLGGQIIDDWLKGVIGTFSDGEFTAGEPQPTQQHPCIGRAPILFLRKRETGKISFLDKILAELNRPDGLVRVPGSLLRVVGSPNSQIEPLPLPGDSVYANEDTDILLTKAANSAQLSILQRLSRSDGVLVQGPPGTGKTHTIANLIGSLLADGKTVLVTSHTAKALRVLRSQITEPLRALCVSVLDSDAEGKKEQQNAVRELVTHLDDDLDQLHRDAVLLNAKRRDLLGEIHRVRRYLETAIQGEYSPIVVDGSEHDPVTAAKRVADGLGHDDWIPGHVIGPLPLSAAEVSGLYFSFARIQVEDCLELGHQLPERDLLVAPSQFNEWLHTIERLTATRLDAKREFWSAADRTHALESTLERIEREIDVLHEAEAWKLAALQAGMDDPAAATVWRGMCELVEETHGIAQDAASALFEHAPQFLPQADTASQQHVLEELIAHVGKGGSLNFWTLTLNPAWKRCLSTARIGEGAQPTALAHFQALRHLSRLNQARAKLVSRWKMHMEPHGLESLTTMNQPEDMARQYVLTIRQYLHWYGDRWQPLVKELLEHGLDWPRLAELAPQVQSLNHRAERLQHAVTHLLPEAIEAEINRRHLDLVLECLRSYAARIKAWLSVPTVQNLIAAIELRDANAYRVAHERLCSLIDLKPDFDQRERWVHALRQSAPGWAEAIERRAPPHQKEQPPGDARRAWFWAQLNQEIDRRSALSISELQIQLERMGKELTETTTELVRSKAWAALIKRISANDDARQALIGWVTVNKKIGKGTGKNAALLQREANRLMEKARPAVPVWIMPFARLTESFDPVRDHFDVLIIDEASQEDVVGIAPFFMADKVIVVGDNEQVTPNDVGGEQQPIQDLISQWLGDIPGSMLFDLKTSVYDRAHMAFGSSVRLKEHFRCVPEIIQFSNWLSYNGEIKPLREASSTPLFPALVAHRVQGFAHGKKNSEEAKAIVSLIASLIQQPEYNGKTVGVISLVGNDQWQEIEKILRSRIDPTDYETRRILCGNPAHFQGDERDVIFLSMVDSKDDGAGPLSLRAEGAADMWKKRYNVAASRAKDQLWVVYSLDHASQLKPGDIRKRLIEHALDPAALMRKLDEASNRTESPFEAEVFKILVAQGFRVKTQWPVGAYRIDMVVEGDNGKRLAIECDGDRWHYNKVAEDLARQALLERLGWVFARIRGTAFYRDRSAAMKPVYEKLKDRGITPSIASIDPQPVPTRLLDAVKRRAAQLQREWDCADSDCL